MNGEGKFSNIEENDIYAIWEDNKPTQIINYMDEEQIFNITDNNVEETIS